VLIADSPPDFVLKFEAEGFAPFVSRRISPDAGEAHFDVTLTKANDALVSVLLPDGRPAAAADVGLISRSSQLMILAGGFCCGLPNSGDVVRTDGKGQFRLPLDPAITRLMVVHKEGFASTSPGALKNETTLRLQAWGRIEGTFRTNGQPAVHQNVQLQFIIDDAINGVRLAAASAYEATTDEQGQFVFPKAPPERLTLIHMAPVNALEPTTWFRFPLSDVEVHPGETTRLDVGGDDRKFALRLRWPEDLPRDGAWNVHVQLLSLLRPIPGATPDSVEALEIAQRTPGAFRSSLVTELADGTWRADTVAPGKYFIDARVVSGSVAGPTLHAVGNSTVVIPAERSAAVLDIGEIVLRKAAKP
jgi:hypothetical protein